ncbi:MAG TPA: hypothetical protein VFV92_05765, partial [Candidatus Bathyarchaeia archaeon]|nr:hypothetical protein [Candidatus Bathyarchaeia archaeon]
MQLETTLHLDDIVEMTNVAEHLSEQDRKVIAKHVIDTFEIDRMSRSQWEHEMAMANKIALQVKEEKSFPWPGAANVKFPLITIACLQYHSRAYPALIDMPDVVKVIPASGRQPSLQPNPQLQPGGAPGQMQPQQPQPPSPQITEAERNWTAAQAVQDHMNWQLSEEDEQWEAETDKTILVQALMGCCFKKIYFDPLKRHNVSECVLPQDLIVSYYTRSLEDASRITHILTWSGNKLIEMQNRGMILDVDVTDAPKVVPVMFGELQQVRDQRQGLNQIATDPDQPFIILEQHLFLDLDDDGYKEPYVAWVKHDSQELLRIAPRFLPSGMEYARPDSKSDKKLIRIVPEKFFTKYGFIPAPDGGFYDLGFGKLLGPLNESINTSINQLCDAGTLKNAGGGFIARGVRTKSGEVSMRPALWMRVDCVGDDLRKNIVPLPVPEPSTVLFQLLSLLIDYGQRVAGAPDIVQGQNPGQNTP